MKYFHGGIGTLRVGMLVLPPSETGAHSNADYGAAHVCRRDRIYITSNMNAAAIFAIMSPCGDGRVYEVEPIGAIEPDLDCIDATLSFQCAKARVVKIYRLRLTKNQRSQLISKIVEGLA